MKIRKKKILMEMIICGIKTELNQNVPLIMGKISITIHSRKKEQILKKEVIAIVAHTIRCI